MNTLARVVCLTVLLADLACMVGMDVSGLPLDTAIGYCGAGKQCYAKRPRDARPNHSNTYGCLSQATCDNLASGSADGGSSKCRKCCAQDGCNAQICQPQDPQGSSTSPTDTTQGVTISPTSATDTIFTDCWDLHNRGGFNETGVYDIYPAPGYSSLRVRCDMTTDGGGWLVLQRRYDGSVNFTRTFQEYEEGFGDVYGEHWLGLKWIHILTSLVDNPVHLRIRMCTFDKFHRPRFPGYAVWNGSSISGPTDTYRLNTGTWIEGTIKGWKWMHDGQIFKATGYCAEAFKGGWWYGWDCYLGNLNGGRYNGGDYQGIVWNLFGGGKAGFQSLMSSDMQIRPAHVTGNGGGPGETCRG